RGSRTSGSGRTVRFAIPGPPIHPFTGWLPRKRALTSHLTPAADTLTGHSPSFQAAPTGCWLGSALASAEWSRTGSTFRSHCPFDKLVHLIGHWGPLPVRLVARWGQDQGVLPHRPCPTLQVA